MKSKTSFLSKKEMPPLLNFDKSQNTFWGLSLKTKNQYVETSTFDVYIPLSIVTPATLKYPASPIAEFVAIRR